MKRENGFTLIELVMVIVILAILGAVAVAQYVNLRDETALSNEAGVAGGVQAGILTFFIDPARGNRTLYPATLDALPDGTACSETNPCFTNVLVQGGITDQWTKIDTDTYRSPVNATNEWTYDPGTGTFQKTVL
jgi:prepilin-type N-terminal cleavage/methylation domain-containing protein